MSTVRKYIIVDDDPFNNILCKMMLKDTLGELDIKTFTAPEDGLAFIQNEYTHTLGPTILFLDINMPTLTGWEFMEVYEKFGPAITEQISVYILSSSVDDRDSDKADANNYIKGFISKPLSHDIILTLAGA
ncbi:MAG: response regulator [Ferruginibacter sp.]